MIIGKTQTDKFFFFFFNTSSSQLEMERGKYTTYNTQYFKFNKMLKDLNKRTVKSY